MTLQCRHNEDGPPKKTFAVHLGTFTTLVTSLPVFGDPAGLPRAKKSTEQLGCAACAPRAGIHFYWEPGEKHIIMGSEAAMRSAAGLWSACLQAIVLLLVQSSSADVCYAELIAECILLLLSSP